MHCDHYCYYHHRHDRLLRVQEDRIVEEMIPSSRIPRISRVRVKIGRFRSRRKLRQRALTLGALVVVNLSGGSADVGAKKNGYCRTRQSRRRARAPSSRNTFNYGSREPTTRNVVACSVARDIFRQLPRARSPSSSSRDHDGLRDCAIGIRGSYNRGCSTTRRNFRC